MRSLRAIANRGMIAAAVCLVASCAGISPREAGSWKRVPIAEFQNVTGKWEGKLMVARNSLSDGDWVRLNIFKTGIYESANAQAIDVLNEGGLFVLAEGVLASHSDKGSLRLTLLSSGDSGEGIIQADAVSSDGQEFSARLKQTSKFPLPLKRRDQGQPLDLSVR